MSILSSGMRFPSYGVMLTGSAKKSKLATVTGSTLKGLKRERGLTDKQGIHDHVHGPGLAIDRRRSISGGNTDRRLKHPDKEHGSC